MIPSIIYARCSTDMQEHSVADQIKNIKDWASRQNYAILKIYQDDGISGHYAAKRPGFMSMIEDITAGHTEAKALLIWDSYRFARNMVEFLTYKQMIRNHGLAVIAVAEPQVADEDAQLYIDAINGASGELYLRKLSKDSKRGIRARVVDRHMHIGTAPYGYEKGKGELVINNEEARWVQFMFDSIQAGEPVMKIVDTLNSKQAYTHFGKPWKSTQVKYCLQNQTYCGRLDVNLDGQHGVYDGSHSSIITTEQFDSVQEIMKDRKARHRKYQKTTTNLKHWLSGLVRCPYCGGSFSYQKTDGRQPRYICNNGRGVRKCKNRSIRLSVLEDLVLGEMERVLKTPEIAVNLVSVSAPAVDVDKAITQLTQRLKRAREAYMAEIDTIEEYRETKSKITAEIERLRNTEGHVQPKVDTEKMLTAYDLLRSDADMEAKIKVGHTLIQRIDADNINKTLTVYFYT